MTILRLDNIPKELLEYSNNNWTKLITYANNGENSVKVFDKSIKKHFIKKIYRVYNSFGKVPSFDSNNEKSYMYSGSESPMFRNIPKLFKPYMDYVNKENNSYNNFVLNFYENGKNYIEPHSDCDKDLIEDYNIIIISLGVAREIKFESRNNTNSIILRLNNGSILSFGKEWNKNYRHSILQSNSSEIRLSLTFRQMKE